MFLNFLCLNKQDSFLKLVLPQSVSNTEKFINVWKNFYFFQSTHQKLEENIKMAYLKGLQKIPIPTSKQRPSQVKSMLFNGRFILDRSWYQVFQHIWYIQTKIGFIQNLNNKYTLTSDQMNSLVYKPVYNTSCLSRMYKYISYDSKDTGTCLQQVNLQMTITERWPLNTGDCINNFSL